MSKQINIEQDNARKAYNEASMPEVKNAIAALCGGVKALDLNMSDRIKSFSDVCREMGVNEDDYAFPRVAAPDVMLGICARRNALISKLFNDGKEFKPGDAIYYAIHRVNVDKTALRGFRLSFRAFVFDDGIADLGARPGFANSDDAVFVGKQLIEEAENMYHWHLQAISNK